MDHSHSLPVWVKLIGLLGLTFGFALPHMALAGSEDNDRPSALPTGPATLCVDRKGDVEKVIFSGTCKAKEIAVPLAPTFEYKIGDTGPGGGIIFFVDYQDQYPGFDYLEAAPEDAPNGPFAWGCNGTSVPGASGWEANAVGRGRANTDTIIAANCGGDAASAAANYVSANSTDDWFLPSEGELMLMYTNLRQAGKGAFRYVDYWSSTEVDARVAWSQDFDYGNQYDVYIKESGLPVRPVRAF